MWKNTSSNARERETAATVLKSIASKNLCALDNPEPLVLIDKFDASSINSLFGVWYEQSKFVDLKNSILIEIHEHLAEEGIDIPFPQTDVYIKEIKDGNAADLPAKIQEVKSSSQDGRPKKENLMDIIPELEKRRAFRAFSSEEISRETMTRVLKAATLAPSCFNNQPWRMIVVKKGADPAYEAAAATLSPGNAWALNAPYLVVFATAASLDCRLDEGRDYAFFDVGQAALALQLQAYREGMRAHPFAGYSPSKLRVALKLPQELVPLCVVAVGKAGDPMALPENIRRGEDSPRVRKPLGETVFENGLDKPWTE